MTSSRVSQLINQLIAHYKFLAKYTSIDNFICYACQTFANADIVDLKC